MSDRLIWTKSSARRGAAPALLMREIHHSQAAKSDLVDIWVETYRQWGEAQADRYLDDIERALQGLIANPQMGSDCS
ncbi:type II toxin-antitoxin system RelE/ParE family toxin, partial [Sulfitobacter sp. HI0054]|uniref:type II toxin-antitoxin system RelE/ParE family toxin n=1 Tax=Sulfitobacter sp. HI0054 TaxID=1822238 RepID=UPI002F917BB5